jgi:translation initiation factor 4G
MSRARQQPPPQRDGGNAYSIGGNQAGYDPDEQVFRRVRGILNKLTIEKFERLVPQLLQVGITSENVLRGIILLIFEKAVDEPTFSSMYAQICLRLSNDGPNFEARELATGELVKGPTTFVRLLLRKCQDEFENRTRAESLLGDVHTLKSEMGPLSAVTAGGEEFRQIVAADNALKKARAKMLGNMKFIGELGKSRLLSEKILHVLIKQLCERVDNPAEQDVECLIELLTTIGGSHDHEKAQRYFDEYFTRLLAMRESKPPLPARLRFLIDDLVELRENGWNNRKGRRDEGPKTIQEVQLDALEDQLSSGQYSNQQERYGSHVGFF